MGLTYHGWSLRSVLFVALLSYTNRRLCVTTRTLVGYRSHAAYHSLGEPFPGLPEIGGLCNFVMHDFFGLYGSMLSIQCNNAHYFIRVCVYNICLSQNSSIDRRRRPASLTPPLHSAVNSATLLSHSGTSLKKPSKSSLSSSNSIRLSASSFVNT